VGRAVAALRRGQLVVVPTDTVYGIAADVGNPAAVRALLAAKGRSGAKPPPVLIGDAEDLDQIASRLSDQAKSLATALWPGGLTLVVPLAPHLGWDLGELAGTVGVRVPDHEVTRELLRAAGPLAVSSANRAGEPPALSAQAAAESFGDAVAVYLDAGLAPGGVPSTVVDATGPNLRILRHGAISAADIAAAAGTVPASPIDPTVRAIPASPPGPPQEAPGL
jgi:tRNA threonylcarbamoyl adenosine modification protein (Sua5/YciO/YrdC/YwlC family)